MILLDVTAETWNVALLGWGIVFIALLCIVGIFLLIPKIIRYTAGKKIKVVEAGKQVEKDMYSMSGETSAVIAAAIKLYLDDVHDYESQIITIKTVRRRYSPWSSKLYGMTNSGFSNRIKPYKNDTKK